MVRPFSVHKKHCRIQNTGYKFSVLGLIVRCNQNKTKCTCMCSYFGNTSGKNITILEILQEKWNSTLLFSTVLVSNHFSERNGAVFNVCS